MSTSPVINHILKDLTANLKIANTNLCDNYWKNEDYFFPFNSIGMVLEGCIYLKTDQYEVTPQKGEAYFLPAGTKQHYRIYNCDRAVIHWCHFTAAIGVYNLFDLINLPLHVQAEVGGHMDYVFQQMITAYHSQVSGMPLKAKGMLYELIFNYLSSAGEHLVCRNDIIYSSTIYEILEYIDKNLGDRLSVKKLASIAGYSPNYFIEIFKKYFNSTPLQYVLGRRRDEAVRMLVQTDWSIKEISIQLGFDNQNNFSEFFKKFTGYSPKAFRNLNECNRHVQKS